VTGSGTRAEAARVFVEETARAFLSRRDDDPPRALRYALRHQSLSPFPPQGCTSVVWLPVWLPNDRKGAGIRTLSCAPSRTRTYGLLLRRHSRSVARRCRAWPDVPFRPSENGWTWPDIAPRLWFVGSQFGATEISLAALMFEQQEAGTGPERKSGQRAHSVKPSAGARR